MNASDIKLELEKLKNPTQAINLQRFFKTGKGEYGEGDIFIGIKVPVLRKLSKEYIGISLKETEKLLQSKIHEYRMAALFILIHKFEKGNESEKKEIFDLYLRNTKYINNWDLVDLSAHKIVGEYLVDKDRKVLYKLAKSGSLWERRISIISTFAFLRNNDFKDAIKISEILLNDKHDLIHKAVGWVLREVGKKDIKLEYTFLDKHALKMPRTMLRYAIEKFSEDKRQYYLKLK